MDNGELTAMSTRDERGSRVCVVGIGAATAVGASAPASAAAVRAGIAMFADHPYMISRDGDPYVVAMAPYVEEGAAIEERFATLALSAGSEALAKLKELPVEPGELPIVLCLPSDRPGLPNDAAARLANQLASSFHAARVKLFPNGHSAGLMGIDYACRSIRSGKAEFCLVGGVDSYLDPDTLDWLEECEQVHNVQNAWGFIPGEGAGFSLLCSEAAASRYELDVLGYLLSVGVAQEENRIKTETVCIGKGLTNAVDDAFQSLASPETLIDDTICDLNGESYRSDEFGFMLARMSEHFANATDYEAPADCWGDVGAASGPLFVALASLAAVKGYAKGPNTLLWTSSEGGDRAAAVFESKSRKTGRH